MDDRGFKKLKGKTIKEIRTDAVNEVKILCTDGTVFTIDTDESFHGIGVARLTKEKAKLESLPKPPRKKRDPLELVTPPIVEDVRDAWPFPKYENMPLKK